MSAHDLGWPWNRIWVGEIEYSRTWQGWLHLATVIDAHPRRMISWAIEDHVPPSSPDLDAYPGTNARPALQPNRWRARLQRPRAMR